MRQIDRATVLKEYEGVRFGDVRVDKRLQRLLPQLIASPSESFPEQMESDADQEALYRFLGNSRVTSDALLGGHHRQTLSRMRSHALVRIVHDTSQFCFEGEREGLGTLQGNDKGFLAHFALAVVANETREPLGVLAVRPFINTHEQRDLTKSQKVRLNRATPRAQKKSSRWEKLAIDVSASLPEGVEALHLMDQEADDYGVFSALRVANVRFVIRAETSRRTADDLRVDAALAEKPTRIFRTVPASARSAKQATKQHPQRAERLATLSVRASTITLKRPDSSRDATLPTVTLQALHVFEPAPPAGETAIEWMLFTSERVDTLSEIEAVVDHYRARWVIEEYFKALKTGCAFEKRQLCSFDGLVRALALFVPMAWTLLALRNLGRESTPRDAQELFSPPQLRLLRALLEKRGRRLAEKPSVRDAMLGIAGLGGHIKNNGDPGWLVLGRGLRRFTEAEEVWNLMGNSDQS
jgi:hypothetical protein